MPQFHVSGVLWVVLLLVNSKKSRLVSFRGLVACGVYIVYIYNNNTTRARKQNHMIQDSANKSGEGALAWCLALVISAVPSGTLSPQLGQLAASVLKLPTTIDLGP